MIIPYVGSVTPYHHQPTLRGAGFLLGLRAGWLRSGCCSHPGEPTRNAPEGKCTYHDECMYIYIYFFSYLYSINIIYIYIHTYLLYIYHIYTYTYIHGPVNRGLPSVPPRLTSWKLLRGGLRPWYDLTASTKLVDTCMFRYIIWSCKWHVSTWYYRIPFIVDLPLFKMVVSIAMLVY